MEVLIDRDGRSPGQRNFGDARLGDTRRTQALADAADRFIDHPHGSLPQKLGGPAAVTRFYRLLKVQMVTHESVLAPHAAHTRLRMAKEPVVLVLHDTTELDYSGRKGLQADLGKIGNGSRRGLLCHNSLAVTPQGRVLGLLNQVIAKRRDKLEGEGYTAKRQHPDRLSRLWPRGLAGCGPTPPGVLVVDISDRGGDTLEYLHAHRRLAQEQGVRRSVIVRSNRDRLLEGEDHLGDDRICLKLREYAQQLPELGQRSVRVHANRGGPRAREPREGRDAVVSVSAGPLTLAPPNRWARGEYPDDAGPLDLWCVYAREVDPPPRRRGVEPVEWLLLTDLPARDFEEACRCLDFYARRPLIEEFHRAMKQGMGVERLRLASSDRLEPAIALLSASAAILLDLRQASADPAAEHEPAQGVVPETHVQVVSAVSGVAESDLTTRRFALEVAKLGGHLPRKNGRPGWITLWRGWERVTSMVQAVEAMKRKRSG